MKLKIILGVLCWTAIAQLSWAQVTGRGYSDTHLLEEIKTWDSQGRLIFKKWCLSDTDFEMEASTFQANGKPDRKWEVLWRIDHVVVKEWRYFADRVETWMPIAEPRLDADPELARAISQFKRAGMPSTREELLGIPALRKILDGPLYCAESSTLNAAGLPLVTTYSESNGEKTGEEISTYDAQGRCIRYTERDFGDEDAYLENLLRYDSEGRLVTTVQLQFTEGERDTVLVSEHRYQDSLLIERIDRMGGMHSSNWTKTTRTYDAQNRLVRDEITDSKTTGPSTYKTFSYDAQNRIHHEEWWRREKGKLNKVRSVTWVYE